MIKIFCLIILSIIYSCGKPVNNQTVFNSQESTCHPPIDISNFTIYNQNNNYNFLEYEIIYEEDSQENLDDSLDKINPCEDIYYENLHHDNILEDVEGCVVD